MSGSSERATVIRRVIQVALAAAAYVILGQVVKFIPNPMVPGAIIAVNMVVVVIAGILWGPVAGAAVGFAGTSVNAFFTPAGNPFEQYAVVPHTIMGIAAGLAARRSIFAGALTILVGHGLNVLSFISGGLLPMAEVVTPFFFSGLLFEIVVDVVVTLFAVPLLRQATPLAA